MKLFPFFPILQGVLLVVFVVNLLPGCRSEGPTKQERKKMPGVRSLSSDWELSFANQSNGLFNFPYQAGYVDLMDNGKTTTFFAIGLPDPGFDSIALSLANSYKPLAIPMLTQWAQGERNGVLLDLRGDHRTGSTRTDYLVESPSFSIPVVLLWNTASSSRVQSLVNMLQSVPSVKCMQTSESRLGANGARQDCFAGY
jgi:hypothetical protein